MLLIKIKKSFTHNQGSSSKFIFFFIMHKTANLSNIILEVHLVKRTVPYMLLQCTAFLVELLKKTTAIYINLMTGIKFNRMRKLLRPDATSLYPLTFSHCSSHTLILTCSPFWYSIRSTVLQSFKSFHILFSSSLSSWRLTMLS
jgi:hypothetical protein